MRTRSKAAGALWEVADTTRVFLVAEGHPFERVLFLSGGRPGRRLPSLVTGTTLIGRQG